jgi:hypothetical protein
MGNLGVATILRATCAFICARRSSGSAGFVSRAISARALLTLAVGLGGLALAAPSAFADGVSISRLPYSSTLEGHVTVAQNSYCDPAIDYCGWYGEASAYPVSVSDAETGATCPDVYDSSRGVWVGKLIDDPNATDSESFTFDPPATSGPIEICLYIHDASGGVQFDTSSLFAVTKARANVSVHLNWVYRCRVSLDAFVNDGNVIGGNFLFAVKRHGRYKTWFVKWPLTDSNFWYEWGRGSYTIRVKFLGDTFVNPSSWVGNISARIRRCSN